MLVTTKNAHSFTSILRAKSGIVLGTTEVSADMAHLAGKIGNIFIF